MQDSYSEMVSTYSTLRVAITRTLPGLASTTAHKVSFYTKCVNYNHREDVVILLTGEMMSPISTPDALQSRMRTAMSIWIRG